MKNEKENIKTENKRLEIDGSADNFVQKYFLILKRNVRQIKMKTNNLFTGLLSLVVLLFLAGCGASSINPQMKISGQSIPVDKTAAILNDVATNDDQSTSPETISFKTLPGSYEAEQSDIQNPGDTLSYDQPVTMETFQDSLSNDGDWVQVNKDEIDPQYVTEEQTDYQDNNNNVNVEEETYVDNDVNTEYIWVPHVSHRYDGWNPYSDGRWVWTYRGWVWESDYSWGWAPYHYGRWWYSPYYGWVWSPGYRWAPAWVHWCYNGGYTGWHPISPRWHFVNNEGNHHHNYQNGWIFVKDKDLTNNINKSIIISKEKSKELVTKSNNFTDITKQNNKIYNPGPNVNEKVKKNETITQNRSNGNVNNGINNNKVPVIKNENTKVKSVTNNNVLTTKQVKTSNSGAVNKNVTINKVEKNNGTKQTKVNTGINNNVNKKTQVNTPTKEVINNNRTKIKENVNNSTSNKNKEINNNTVINNTRTTNPTKNVPNDNVKINKNTEQNTNSKKINTTPQNNPAPKVTTPKVNSTPSNNTTRESNNSSNSTKKENNYSSSNTSKSNNSSSNNTSKSNNSSSNNNSTRVNSTPTVKTTPPSNNNTTKVNTNKNENTKIGKK